MSKLTNKLMIAAAAMVVATGVASAQTLKANVPFAYRVSGKTMSAGSYNVSVTVKGMTEIRSKDGRSAVLALSTSHIDGGDSGDARMVFSCMNGTCTLVQVWSGIPGEAFAYPRPKDRDYEASLIVVPLHRNAD